MTKKDPEDIELEDFIEAGFTEKQAKLLFMAIRGLSDRGQG